tara:strand:- start:459 stop:893 length:435 start_codon:yes stop_codon:yes gene_type:complete
MKISDVVEFGERSGEGNIFTYWTRDEIDQHLYLHHTNGTLIVASDDDNVLGFLTYRRIKDFDGNISTHFWEPNDPSGTDVYIHELCSAADDVTYTLFLRFEELNPDADSLNYWAHRKYKLKKYSYKHFRRLKLCQNRNRQNHLT